MLTIRGRNEIVESLREELSRIDRAIAILDHADGRPRFGRRNLQRQIESETPATFTSNAAKTCPGGKS